MESQKLFVSCTYNTYIRLCGTVNQATRESHSLTDDAGATFRWTGMAQHLRDKPLGWTAPRENQQESFLHSIIARRLELDCFNVESVLVFSAL